MTRELRSFAVPHSALGVLARSWWLIFLRGVCAVAFGFAALAWPGITIVTLILLYGIYLLADGLFAIVSALVGTSRPGPWWVALGGFISVAAGAATFALPAMTTFILLYVIAAWAIAVGCLQIAGAVALRKEIPDEWFLIASGVLSIFFGVLIAARPGVGAVALVWVIGTFAILYGILLMGLSLRLRHYDRPHSANRSLKA